VTTETSLPRCTLHGAVGRAEQCPGAECPFWEQAAERCVLGGLEFELLCRPPVAEHLLELRAALEQARPATS
jgi:hypothetical protein